MPPTAFLDGDFVLLQEPVRKILQSWWHGTAPKKSVSAGYLLRFQTSSAWAAVRLRAGLRFTVKFQLATPTRPILSFADMLFQAVEQVDLVQSGTFAQLHDLNTQVPHGLGRAGVLHAL